MAPPDPASSYKLPNIILPPRHASASPPLLGDVATTRRYHVVCVPDLPYNDAAPMAHTKQRLDLYVPVDAGATPISSAMI